MSVQTTLSDVADLQTAKHTRAMQRRNVIVTILMLVLFVAAGLWQYNDVDGDDLSASYVGCRLVASGESSHLYAHDPVNFAAVGPDNAWQHAADEGGYIAFLHPYVQTPIWAYSLQPLCKRTDFQAFERVFAVLEMLSFAGCIGLIAWFWTPSLFRPVPIAAVIVALWFSQPFQYAMFLMQTHVLFLLLTLASLIFAERKRPGLAGLLLACAAAVKVTPAILVIYWLVRRQWKPALFTIAWSALLWAITVRIAGPQLAATYLATLHRVSNIVLLSQNNQSFAAWCVGLVTANVDTTSFNVLPLPAVVRIGSTLLTLACAIAGGLLDRRMQRQSLPIATLHSTVRPSRAYPGALLTLVAATAFAPISWTHYAIVLLAPAMVLGQAWLDLRRWWTIAALTVIVTLNIRPFATDVIDSYIGRFSLLRGHFFAEILCIIALAALAWIQSRASTARSSLHMVQAH